MECRGIEFKDKKIKAKKGLTFYELLWVITKIGLKI